MDKIQFLKGMKYLGTMYDKSFTEEKIGLMYNLFENDDYDVYKQAIKNLVIKEQYMPNIAKIKNEMLCVVSPELRNTSTEEWNKVLNVVRNYGIYNQEEGLKTLNNLTKEVVEEMGFHLICESTEITKKEKQFKELFDEKINSIKQSLLDKNKIEYQEPLYLKEGEDYE